MTTDEEIMTWYNFYGINKACRLSEEKAIYEERARIKAEWDKLLLALDKLEAVAIDNKGYALIRYCEARVLLHELEKKVFEK